MNRTTTPKPDTLDRQWHVIDAAGVPVGRLAAKVAQVLRGKHKPTFSYHIDTGDFVIVINAEQALLTGSKGKELLYWHTGWPGGIRNISKADLLENNPVRLIEKSVWGMLPKGRLGRQIVKKLKVYAGSEHPHAAQNPATLEMDK
ncbi:MAG: 50S ribosomal protein L13 [Fimbriimonadaceae bacterium]|nr:50S ribosomal protein L13 [Fimbriimonadaceae bacterium]QYK52582.1 MAG: 50S ribosomal protein L13 [Fimbriimonadaceae bacterium]